MAPDCKPSSGLAWAPRCLSIWWHLDRPKEIVWLRFLGKAIQNWHAGTCQVLKANREWLTNQGKGRKAWHWLPAIPYKAGVLVYILRILLIVLSNKNCSVLLLVSIDIFCVRVKTRRSIGDCELGFPIAKVSLFMIRKSRHWV